MKIKELLELLSESKGNISEIRINGFHFESFDEIHDARNLEVGGWKVSIECDKVILIIHTEEPEEPENEDSVEEDEEDELTVSDVLSNICFDDENTIVIFDRTGSKVYDSDEDDVFALCELLCLDVREYAQIHRGKHQIIEIHLNSY